MILTFDELVEKFPEAKDFQHRDVESSAEELCELLVKEAPKQGLGFRYVMVGSAGASFMFRALSRDENICQSCDIVCTAGDKCVGAGRD